MMQVQDADAQSEEDEDEVDDDDDIVLDDMMIDVNSTVRTNGYSEEKADVYVTDGGPSCIMGGDAYEDEKADEFVTDAGPSYGGGGTEDEKADEYVTNAGQGTAPNANASHNIYAS